MRGCRIETKLKNLGMCLLLILLAIACAGPNAVVAVPKAAPASPEVVVVTATPLPPDLATPQNLLLQLSLPTASAAERKEASSTWLYLSFFQSFNVSVIDPKSGHTVHEIRTAGDRAGVAVAPDGARLYVVDGQINGELRVYDTSDWQMIHQEPVADFATLFANPVSLSGDGHWLIVSRYNWQSGKGWLSLFDPRRLQFLPDNVANTLPCGDYERPPRLIGRTGHGRLYVVCAGSVTAVDRETLSRLWQMSTPVSMNPDFALAPDGGHLFGLYPQVHIGYDSGGNSQAVGTDLLLYVWETGTGRLVKKIKLSDQVSVPSATIGRGEAGYLRVSPDGTRLYVVWEDAVWTVVADSLRVSGELKLPAPIDGVALSDDGCELYLLPSTVGNLSVRGHGLWTVDTSSLKLVRRASDWPEGLGLFDVTLEAAPAPARTTP